jgi:hypothetical protein
VNVKKEEEESVRGLMVRVIGLDSKVTDSIPGTNRFSEKYWVWNGVHSAS